MTKAASGLYSGTMCPAPAELGLPSQPRASRTQSKLTLFLITCRILDTQCGAAVPCTTDGEEVKVILVASDLGEC